MNSQNRTETDSQIQKTNWWFVYQWREGTEWARQMHGIKRYKALRIMNKKDILDSTGKYSLVITVNEV